MNIRTLPSRSLNFQSPHSLFCGFKRRSTLDPIEQLLPKNEDVNLPDWMKEGARVIVRNHLRK